MKIQVRSYGTLDQSNGSPLFNLAQLIVEAFEHTRFILPELEREYTPGSKKYKGWVNIPGGRGKQKVKLKEKKFYCGNHPSGCELAGKRDKRGTHLEGVDWVEFNDRLNSVCDLYSVDADINSMFVCVRRGRERCIEYVNGRKPAFGNYEWGRYGTYADYCMDRTLEEAPPALFPEGTPGIYERTGYHCVG